MGKSRKILKIWGKYYGKFGKILLKVRISILDTKSLSPAMDASRRIFYTGYYWGESRQAGKDRGQGESSIRLLIRCYSRPPSDGARNSQPGSFVYFLASIEQLCLFPGLNTNKNGLIMVRMMHFHQPVISSAASSWPWWGSLLSVDQHHCLQVIALLFPFVGIFYAFHKAKRYALVKGKYWYILVNIGKYW